MVTKRECVFGGRFSGESGGQTSDRINIGGFGPEERTRSRLFRPAKSSVPSRSKVDNGCRSATRESRADEGVRPTLAPLHIVKN